MTAPNESNPIRPALALASKSVRRLELLTEAGYDAIAIGSSFDDADTPNVGHPDQLVTQLARLKALGVVNAPPGRIVIAADTLALSPTSQQHDGHPELLGQPESRDDAERMLRLMLGHTHTILTGIALLHPPSHQLTLYRESAQVTLGEIPEETLQAYLDTNAWQGKAGAYNLFEIQNQWPVQIDGDPTTIVGLPIDSLKPRLQAFMQQLP